MRWLSLTVSVNVFSNNLLKPLGRLVLFGALAVSCSDDENPAGYAEINGTPFTPSSAVAVISGKGLFVELASGTSYLRLWVPRYKTGTLSVFNARHGAGCGVEMQAIAEFLDDSGKVHYSVSGTLTVSLVGGIASGRFSFYAESMDDSEVTVSNGTFTIPVSGPPRCVLTRSERQINDNQRITHYAYNQAGNLVGISQTTAGETISAYISYHNTKPVSIATGGTLCSSLTLLNYSGDKISSTANPTSHAFQYNGSLLQQYTYFTDQTFTFTYSEESNLVESTWAYDAYTYTVTYGDYDDQPNPSTLVLPAVDQQQAVLVLLNSFFPFIPATGSANNPRQLGAGTVEYEYNKAGYPVKITFKDFAGNPVGMPILLSYTSCR